MKKTSRVKPPPHSGLRRWHNRCGLAMVVFIVLASVSGSLLVYKTAIIRGVLIPGAELPVGYDVAAVASDLDRIGQTRDLAAPGLIKAPSVDEPYWNLTLDSGVVVLLVPGTLEVYAHDHALLRALAFVRHLHTELLAGVAGEVLLFAAGLITLFLAVSGVIVWWPGRRGFQWRWALPLRYQRGRPLLYHRHFGVVVAVALLLVVTTGTVMLQQRLANLIAPGPVTESTPPSAEAQSAAEQVPPSLLLALAAARIPEGWPTYIRLPVNGDVEARFRFRLPGEWHPNGRSSVTVDASRREIVAFSRADEASLGRRLLNQMYPLHSGYGLSAAYSLLVFVAGLGCCWLAWTGTASWLRRRSSQAPTRSISRVRS